MSDPTPPEQPMRVTIRSVAKLAGVAPSTVSQPTFSSWAFDYGIDAFLWILAGWFYRSFETTEQYRIWCEEHLPEYLGYGREKLWYITGWGCDTVFEKENVDFLFTGKGAAILMGILLRLWP